MNEGEIPSINRKRSKPTTGIFETREELERKIVFLKRGANTSKATIAKNVGVSIKTVESILFKEIEKELNRD
jgi:hypothetical protein